MAKNARPSDQDIAFLRVLVDLLQDTNREPQPDKIHSDHASNDLLVDLLEPRSARAALFRLRDAVMQDEDERRRIVAAADPKAMFGWSDPLSPRGFDWWRAPQSFETYMSERNRLRVLLVAMRDRLPASALAHRGVPADLRVSSLADAFRGMPEHGLLPIAKTTLYGWLDAEKTARVLGTDHRAKPGTQRPLVRGLLDMQKLQQHPKAKGARGQQHPKAKGARVAAD